MAAFAENTRDINTFHVKKAYRSIQNKEHRGSQVIKKRILVLSTGFMFLMACFYMIAQLFSSPDKSVITQKTNVPIQTKQKSTLTAISNVIEITPTQSQTSSEEHPQTKRQARQDISEPMITESDQPTGQLTRPQMKSSKKSDIPAIQRSKGIDIKNLPIQSLFTKNSYCIVVTPETNRMVVFQGKPKFKSLTSNELSSFQLDEGVYFMDNDQPAPKRDTSTAVLNPQSSVHHDLSENNISSSNLTITQSIAPDPPESLTENESKQLTPIASSQENERDQLPSKELSQENERDQLPSKKSPIFQTQSTEIQKESLAQQITQVQGDKPQPINDHSQKPEQKKIHSASELKEIKQPEINDNLNEIISLPPDKRLALISLGTRQLTLWKGTSKRPKLIKQAQMNFTGPEGIYILCKHNNKQVLFNPDMSQQLQSKIAEELWQAIDPITNVTPVIVRSTHKKNFGSHVQRLKSLVFRWESAWQQKDLDAYMHLYIKDIIYFYKLNAPAIKLNWKILKSSQTRIFSANRQKVLSISPATYVIDPKNSDFALALFNQTYSDSNYSETGVMILYLKYTISDKNKPKDWQIYGRLRLY
jgi:hypothetical protein